MRAFGASAQRERSPGDALGSPARALGSPARALGSPVRALGAADRPIGAPDDLLTASFPPFRRSAVGGQPSARRGQQLDLQAAGAR